MIGVRHGDTPTQCMDTGRRLRFEIEKLGSSIWRPDRESNPGARICSPLRHHSAIGPLGRALWRVGPPLVNQGPKSAAGEAVMRRESVLRVSECSQIVGPIWQSRERGRALSRLTRKGKTPSALHYVETLDRGFPRTSRFSLCSTRRGLVTSSPAANLGPIFRRTAAGLAWRVARHKLRSA